MADSDLPTKGRQRGVRAVELNVAARLENLALLRTLVGAIGTFEDLDFDAVADLRLAVDEVCTRLIRSALPDAPCAWWSIREKTKLWWRLLLPATPTTWWHRAALAGMS